MKIIELIACIITMIALLGITTTAMYWRAEYHTLEERTLSFDWQCDVSGCIRSANELHLEGLHEYCAEHNTDPND